MTNNRDYERHIAHATEVNFLNNCYTLPITINFFTTDSNSTVNISSKYCTLSSPSEFLIFPPQLSKHSFYLYDLICVTATMVVKYQIIQQHKFLEKLASL